MNATFVIVGGGIAGVTCAETLSFLSPDESIILLTKSKLVKAVTQIVPISKMLFDFKIEEKEACSLSEAHQNIKVIEDSIVRIENSTSSVYTLGNKIIKYRYLCLCTGGEPKLITNSETNPYVLGIRDTDSVNILQEKIKHSRRVLVIGNGGIASEFIYEVKNVEIVWAIKNKHISAKFIDPGAAEFFQTELKKPSEKPKTCIKRMRYSEGEDIQKGGAALGPDWQKDCNMIGALNLPRSVTVEYECEVENIKINTTNEFPVTVKLTNGKTVNCDLIISATGVLPSSNIDCDTMLDLSEDGGISVNWKMETSIPNIYASGDVCSTTWPPAKHWFQMRLWTQARQMGAYVAKCMSAALNNEEVIQDFCFELFAHATNLFGYKVVLLGLYNGQKLDNNYECLLRTTPGMEYIKLVIVDGKIQGAVLIGDTGLEETIENLILNQLDVTPYGEDLLNPDIDIEDYFD